MKKKIEKIITVGDQWKTKSDKIVTITKVIDKQLVSVKDGEIETLMWVDNLVEKVS